MDPTHFITSSLSEPMSTIISTAKNDISGDNEHHAYVARDALLSLLWGDKTARVRATKASPRLKNIEECIDLPFFSEGVHTVSASGVLTTGHVLARHSVGKETWTGICSRLTSTPSEAEDLKERCVKRLPNL